MKILTSNYTGKACQMNTKAWKTSEPAAMVAIPSALPASTTTTTIPIPISIINTLIPLEKPRPLHGPYHHLHGHSDLDQAAPTRRRAVEASSHGAAMKTGNVASALDGPPGLLSQPLTSDTPFSFDILSLCFLFQSGFRSLYLCLSSARLQSNRTLLYSNGSTTYILSF